MTTPVQLSFPYASLDFEGHTILTADMIAAKLNYSVQHILNLVDDGSLVALDGKGRKSTRRSCRVPLENYRKFIMDRLTGPTPEMREFIHQLPRHVRVELMREIKESLAS
jgi:hypothetical protein